MLERSYRVNDDAMVCLCVDDWSYGNVHDYYVRVFVWEDSAAEPVYDGNICDDVTAQDIAADIHTVADDYWAQYARKIHLAADFIAALEL